MVSIFNYYRDPFSIRRFRYSTGLGDCIEAAVRVGEGLARKAFGGFR